MALAGDAFMAIWHDVTPEAEAEYERWHTREHMPERLAIPGFRLGRRGVGRRLGKYRYLTLYEGADVGVFGSPAYLERLNNPTPWTRRIAPNMTNFVRGACELLATAGAGIGGAMTTVRLLCPPAEAPRLRAAAAGLASAIHALDGVSAVHVGLARHDVSGAPTRETELRGGPGAVSFSAALLVDAIGRGALEAAHPQLLAILAAGAWAIQEEGAAVYELSYALGPQA
jgi:hypothetical protein